MTNRFRHVAPAGAPIRPRDLWTWSRHLASGEDSRVSLASAVERRLGGAGRCYPVSTGRAALTIILQALRDIGHAGCDEVIVPSYTCFSVPAAVVGAGLRPRVADIVPGTLDYDGSRLARLDTRRTLAIVATNLYGIPNDMPRLASFAHAHGLFLIDDAAQALGAEVGGRPSGTWGDAGLLSFDKGKNVPAIDGGVIVAKPGPVAEAIRARVERLPEPPAREIARGIVKAAAYAALLAPQRYWLPARMPWLGLGRTIFDPRIRLEKLSPALAALAATMLAHESEFRAARRSNSEMLVAGLKDVAGLSFVGVPRGADEACLRLPVLVDEPRRRPEVIEAVNRRTGGATASYPASIADISELAGIIDPGPTDAAGGRFVADRIVTLPTHPYVSRSDVREIVSAVREALAATEAPEGRAARAAAVAR